MLDKSGDGTDEATTSFPKPRKCFEFHVKDTGNWYEAKQQYKHVIKRLT